MHGNGMVVELALKKSLPYAAQYKYGKYDDKYGKYDDKYGKYDEVRPCHCCLS